MDDEAKSPKIQAIDDKAGSLLHQEEVEAIMGAKPFTTNSFDSANEENNKRFEAALDETNKKYGDMLKKLAGN